MNKFLHVLSLIFFCILFGCDNNEKKTLVVGTSADYPPFTFRKNKTITGFDIDLAQEIAKRLGYKLHIKDMRFSELVPALEKNKIDFCISAISATSERARVIDFSTRYYLSEFSLIYRKDSPINSMHALEGKTIAVQRGSTMESFLKARLSMIKNAKIVSFDRNSLMLKDLKKKQVDCILIELTGAKSFCSVDNKLAYSFISAPATSTNYAIAFPKGSKLRAEFDDVLLKLKISNVFDILKEKWVEHA
jgi:polar amino acid transport system substrate-binding protein